MKKILYSFLCASLFAIGATAQSTLTFVSNSWEDGDGVLQENSQGTVALDPSMDIESGFKVTVSFVGTTTGSDQNLSTVVVDTANGGWTVVSSWGSTSVTSGAIAGSITFNATSAVVSPVLVLSTSAGETYNDVVISFSSLLCTVTDPNYRDPNVTTDSTVLPLSNLNGGWSCEYNSTTHKITFPKAWECGAGWAWWDNYLDISAYESVTIEFETSSCQIQLAVQTDNGTEDGENTSNIAEAGSTSVTVKFEDCFVGDWTGVRQIYLQSAEACDLVLTAAYMTYKSQTGIENVSNAKISNGIVYSEGMIEVYNISGKKVAEANNQFNTSNLEKGIYIIKTQENVIKFLK